MTNTSKITEVLIDGDILCYKIGYIADAEAKYKNPEGWKDEDYAGLTMWHLSAAVSRILDKFENVESYKLFISGPTNFRKEVATLKPYKGNRTSEKPKYYHEIREFMVHKLNAIVANNQEADDLLGIYQTNAPKGTSVICSIDKDLDMIPGWHYNTNKDTLYDVTTEDANRFFIKQVLTGDATDNIGGLPGCGPKTADKILANASTIPDAVAAVQLAYRDHYGPKAEEILEETARLIWIRRKPDQDPPVFASTKKKVISEPEQVEDQDADGQLRSEIGIREESVDQTDGTEDSIPVRSGEDPIHDSGEDSHVYAGCVTPQRSSN